MNENEMCEGAQGRCGRYAVHELTFIACGHALLLCDREATNLRVRLGHGDVPCTVCSKKGPLRGTSTIQRSSAEAAAGAPLAARRGAAR